MSLDRLLEPFTSGFTDVGMKSNALKFSSSYHIFKTLKLYGTFVVAEDKLDC